MNQVVIFGNGQVASLTYYCLTHDSPYQVVGFTVDRGYITEKTHLGLPVVPFEQVETIYPPDECNMLVSISFRRVNKFRAEKYFQAKAKGYRLISYVSSKAVTWPDLAIGENCIIGSNCEIQPFVKLGNNVTVGSGTIIGHHSVIKDHCSLAIRVTISGSVTVESYCFLGSNATIRDRVTIAPEGVIGAGAVILQDTQTGEVYAGPPAELLPITSLDLPLG